MKKTTGHLLKRGNNFYVSWRFKTKAFLKVLRDDNGNSITTEREANKAKDKLMAPFAVGNEADVLESITSKLEGRKAELAKWEDKKIHHRLSGRHGVIFSPRLIDRTAANPPCASTNFNGKPSPIG